MILARSKSCGGLLRCALYFNKISVTCATSTNNLILFMPFTLCHFHSFCFVLCFQSWNLSLQDLFLSSYTLETIDFQMRYGFSRDSHSNVNSSNLLRAYIWLYGRYLIATLGIIWACIAAGKQSKYPSIITILLAQKYKKIMRYLSDLTPQKNVKLQTNRLTVLNQVRPWNVWFFLLSGVLFDGYACVPDFLPSVILPILPFLAKKYRSYFVKENRISYWKCWICDGRERRSYRQRWK